MTDTAAMYPEGRTLFYEGPNSIIDSFVQAMEKLGLGDQVSVTVRVPPEHLDTVMDHWPVGT